MAKNAMSSSATEPSRDEGTVSAPTSAAVRRTTGCARRCTSYCSSPSLYVVTWSPPYRANLVWAIGTSDQRAGEFRFSPSLPAGGENIAGRTGRMYGPDATHGVWTVPPASTVYTAAISKPDTDWYFAQSVDGTWTVNFDLASESRSSAVRTSSGIGRVLPRAPPPCWPAHPTQV